MTQTTDSTVDQIRAWLAAQPCPEPNCVRGTLVEAGEPGQHERADEACKGTGLAFPWASELCPFQKRREDPPHVYLGDCQCNGSGRVPTDMELEELLERFPMTLRPPIEGCCPNHAGWQAGLSPLPSETPTLAVLRAVAAKAGMR